MGKFDKSKLKPDIVTSDGPIKEPEVVGGNPAEPAADEMVTAELKPSKYGTCPWCSGAVNERDGNMDTCIYGHTYPSTDTLTDQ